MKNCINILSKTKNFIIFDLVLIAFYIHVLYEV